ncbi:hypothetical protein RB6172 [Rhodopirellula baltica SH 1]|uniref:Uncharacterized protein n=1 Tax=Rhodopirellula baltica (strain DSM 10527 / NCIMB 13988 / SH1) TaxID=243090 RepID=Q7UQQ1_RHOBA|nr:hypothetical protein RB6172 [Rhodopirellula baltica SH 1]
MRNVSSPYLLEQLMSRPQVSDPLFSKDAGMIELNPMSRLGVSPMALTFYKFTLPLGGSSEARGGLHTGF